MPRAKRPANTTEGETRTNEAQALVETLRAVASQIEADPTLAVRLMAGTAATAEHEAPAQATPRPAREVVAPPLDPFTVLRQSGEQGLQEALASLDLASLKAIVRAYRLDPARISARWTTPERIVELIVEQAQARLNHGRAFERV
jgi:inactivated superfamily I helicase